MKSTNWRPNPPMQTTPLLGQSRSGVLEKCFPDLSLSTPQGAKHIWAARNEVIERAVSKKTRDEFINKWGYDDASKKQLRIISMRSKPRVRQKYR